MTFPFMQAFHSDVLWRPVKFVRGKVEQQGLLAVYDNHPAFHHEAVLTAYALDSGRTFPNVFTGASGLNHTVLTKGLVCFGQPRDGSACFMAAPDYRLTRRFNEFTALKRGKIEFDEVGNPVLRWSDAGGGTGLLALTFAGGAFHAVYLVSDYGPTRVETSFDGTRWDNQTTVFPLSEMGAVGGAVAFNGDTETTPGNYAAAGSDTIEAPDEEPQWTDDPENLAWATAAKPAPPLPPEEGELPAITPLSWGYGFVSDPRENPGQQTGDNTGENQQGSIAGGNGIFVAATYEKEIQFVEFGSFDRQFVAQTGAVAFSLNGSSWKNQSLPGVQEGFWEPSVVPSNDKSGNSVTKAVLFVRNKTPQESYFLCATSNFYADQAIDGSGTTWGTVHKSYDGKNWTLVRSIGAKDDLGTNYVSALSVIDANLDNTTIVTLV